MIKLRSKRKHEYGRNTQLRPSNLYCTMRALTPNGETRSQTDVRQHTISEGVQCTQCWGVSKM